MANKIQEGLVEENSEKIKGTSAPKPDDPANNGDVFRPFDPQTMPMIESGLPPEIWTIVQSAPANFDPKYFLDVSRNMLENPNLTASHLSRAELSYQSFTDPSYNPAAKHPHELANIVKHMKADHQPLTIADGYLGYTLEWTVVRKLIPRNAKLDSPLLQTCHLFTSTSAIKVQKSSPPEETVDAERYLILYLPHASSPDEIPFYHPKVRALAILYTYQQNTAMSIPTGTLSIYYDLFPTYPLDNRLSRTALKMLEIIHKHARGRQAGYQKRVHHDVIIPQKTFQDTYSYLKGKYAKGLIDNWVEQTPAQKHVFEDLGIAAFLIELWVDMYGREDAEKEGEGKCAGNAQPRKLDRDTEHSETNEDDDSRRKRAQQNFPGFADIGCGNGLLVWILNEEGWNGWGFDARGRKTWGTFGPAYEDKLKEMLLIPEILRVPKKETEAEVVDREQDRENTTSPSHNGIFPAGTFLVANHADELTVWTPCLAFLSNSPYIAIPCCSHNFGGTRFRAPSKTSSGVDHKLNFQPGGGRENSSKSNAVKQPSAYASFCSYIAGLAVDTEYTPEKEHLRIPSTRNVAIIGRKTSTQGNVVRTQEEKLEFLRSLVEHEMPDTSIEQVGMQWVKRGDVLMKPGKGTGH